MSNHAEEPQHQHGGDRKKENREEGRVHDGAILQVLVDMARGIGIENDSRLLDGDLRNANGRGVHIEFERFAFSFVLPYLFDDGLASRFFREDEGIVVAGFGHDVGNEYFHVIVR